MPEQVSLNQHSTPAARSKIYFGAGPAKLPQCILNTMQQEFKDIAGTGLSITELSHRSKEYDDINKRAINGIKRLCGFGDDYSVLLVPGGATLQFSAWLYNVMYRVEDGESMHRVEDAESMHRVEDAESMVIDYIISGYWSEKAAQEAQRLGFKIRRIQVIERVSDEQGIEKVVVRLPSVDTLSKIVYYCQNETIDGVELPELDLKDRIAICDVSSNILSRPINPSLYTVLFAGAQKNVGVAGVTIVACKKSVCIKPPTRTAIPCMLDYATHDKSASIYNTPPVFAVYAMALVVEWLTSKFGTLHKLDEYSKKKAGMLYSLADHNSKAIYAPVHPPNYRSRINVILKLAGNDQKMAEDALASTATQHGFEGIKGHRHAGGLRVSVYNAITPEEVQTLIDFLKQQLKL